MRGLEASLAIVLALVTAAIALPGAAATPDVDVAVIDSGINPDHDAFCDGQVEVWEDLVNGRETPYDDTGHGTATASRVGGGAVSTGGTFGGSTVTLGAYPCVDLHVYKVLDQDGTTSAFALSRAIHKAVANGAEVASVSISGSIPFPVSNFRVASAVDHATDQGVSVVFSAGNDGELPPPASEDAASHGPSEAYTGSGAPDALVVGASDRYGDRADFSQRNPELLSPGEDVWVADHDDPDDADRGSGTSYSAPWMAGAAARLLADGAPQDPGWLEWVLLHEADDALGVPYANEGYGVFEGPQLQDARAVAQGEAPVPLPDRRDVPHAASLALRAGASATPPDVFVPPYGPPGAGSTR